MKEANKIYRLFLGSLLLCCIISCKKNKGTVVPVVDESVTYEPTSVIFPNPERGFVRNYPVFSEGESLNLTQLKLQRGNNISTILRVFYLEKFKNQALSAAELSLIQTDLDRIREA